MLTKLIKWHGINLFVRVDRVTDDVLLGDASEHESFIGDRYVLTPKDYILLVLGARDYNYLMHENTHHMLDNECTSLYPLESHTMLQFILFMVSHKSPRMAHLLKLKKSMVDGVLSTVVKSLVTTKNRKKPLPNSITEGDFALLRMPRRFVLTPRHFPLQKTPPVNLNNHTRLYCGTTEMLTHRQFFARIQLDTITDLEHVFKTDVLFFLPRFYFNHYSHIYGELQRKSSVLRTMGLAEPTDVQGRGLHSSVFSFTDRRKMHLRMQVDDDALKNIHRNTKRFYEKMGQNPPPLDEKERKRYLWHLSSSHEEHITSEQEVHEFLLKSILLRRPPHSAMNTAMNRTNGFYLLKGGVARLRELAYMEMLNSPEMVGGKKGLMDLVNIGQRWIEVSGGHGKTRKRLGIYDIVDMDNRPFLLKQSFMDLLDRIYGRHEVHLLIKYAQVYTRLFNHLGADVALFLLGAELSGYTEFDYARHVERYMRWMREEAFVVRHTDFTFQRFEAMMYGGKRRLADNDTVADIPTNPRVVRIMWRMVHHGLYTRERMGRTHKKLLLKDL